MGSAEIQGQITNYEGYIAQLKEEIAKLEAEIKDGYTIMAWAEDMYQRFSDDYELRKTRLAKMEDPAQYAKTGRVYIPGMEADVTGRYKNKINEAADVNAEFKMEIGNKERKLEEKQGELHTAELQLAEYNSALQYALQEEAAAAAAAAEAAKAPKGAK